MIEEQKIEERKNKIKAWLKDPYNIILLGILLFAATIKLYFLAIAKNQAHWWDTLAFGSIAKNMIYGYWSNTPFIISETAIRPPLLSLVWSLLLRLNFSDVATIFLLEIIPSVLSILLVYLIAKELYDKRVGIIASFIFSILWIQSFYSVRIMSDIPSLFLALASIYFFVKSYEKIDLKPFALAIFFIALAIMTRYFYGIIGAIYILIMLITHKQAVFKNRNFWVGGIIGSLPLLVFLAINFINSGTLLPAASYYSGSAAGKPAFAFYTFSFITYILQKSFILFFFIGAVILLGELGFGFDKINKIKKLKSHLILALVLLIPLAFFIFWLRAAEDRYLFVSMISLVALTAYGIIFVYDYIKRYSKIIAAILVLALLTFGAYGQLSFANKLINDKKTSYMQMKDAFVWIKDNTPRDSVLLGDGIDPYAIYYSERRIINWGKETLDESVKEADYIILHGFEHQSKELLDYVNNKTRSEFLPVQAYFFDSAKKQPAVIIYEVKKI